MTPSIKKFFLVLGAAILLVIIGIAGRGYLMSGHEGPSQSGQVAAIGGPFTLVDDNGKTVTDADYRGKFLLVYFGYTYCPDVCPTSLTAIQDTMNLLGDKANEITPLFITVDPARDTPEHLKEYVRYFDPRTVGLTGTPEQIAAVAKAYHVYYKKVQEKGAEPDDYLMEHSSIIYLMGPDGKYVTHFNYGAEPTDMAARIRKEL